MTSTARPSRSTSGRKAAAKAAAPGLGSQLVATLEKTWVKVQEFAAVGDIVLPDVVFTTGSGLRFTSAGIGIALASIRFDTWAREEAEGRQHQLFVSGESLGRGPEDALVSILHEAAHLVNFIAGTQDTSRGNAYHNMHFVEAARTFGLDYQHVTPGGKLDPHDYLGFSDVQLTDLGREVWKDELAALAKGIKATIPTPTPVVAKNPDDPKDPRVTLAPDVAAEITKTVRRRRLSYSCGCRSIAMFADEAGEDEMGRTDVECGRCGAHFAR